MEEPVIYVDKAVDECPAHLNLTERVLNSSVCPGLYIQNRNPQDHPSVIDFKMKKLANSRVDVEKMLL